VSPVPFVNLKSERNEQEVQAKDSPNKEIKLKKNRDTT
jgi:hypothetical protein